jgi:proteasome lid subunit RPN8/RPN11
MRFRLEGANWSLEFAPGATSVMRANAQTKLTSSEAVGQLYTRDLTGATVIVEHASLLVPRRASRGRVQFDPQKAYAERTALFKRGLHCIGIWHTHPERHPSPSGEDRALARDYAIAARPALAGIVFVIVGTLPPPNTFRVWVDNGNALRPAETIPQS